MLPLFCYLFLILSLPSQNLNKIDLPFDIPEGFIKDGSDTNYVGTAWTFTRGPQIGRLFTWGRNEFGELMTNTRGQNTSSPVQVPGTLWAHTAAQLVSDKNLTMAVRTDGTLWIASRNDYGQLGQNTDSGSLFYSSPRLLYCSTIIVKHIYRFILMQFLLLFVENIVS